MSTYDSLAARSKPPLPELGDLLRREPESGPSKLEPPKGVGPEKFILMVSGSPGGPKRYRCTHKLEECAYLGLTGDSILTEQMNYENDLWRYEMFLLHRVQNSSRLERFISRARQLNKPVIYDTDDLIFDERPDRLTPASRYYSPYELRMHRDFVYRNGRALELSDAAIVTTDRLYDCIKELFPQKPVFVHRNAVSNKFLNAVEHVRATYVRPPTDVLRIAYVSGSQTHKDDFAECVRPLRRLLERYRHVRLMVVGHLEVPDEVKDFTEQVEVVPPMPWYQIPLCYAMVDINLAPLEMNNLFTESKSELKYFEPAFMEVPTVASDVAPFRVGITQGETGFLCANEEQWYESLERLILDADLRKRIGKASRVDAEARYTTKARSENLKEIIDQISVRSSRGV